MRWSLQALPFVIAVASACGRQDAATPPAFVATGGTYQDGTGRAGVAVLATLRDGAGAGPSSPWDVVLRDGSGVAGYATYRRAGAGSYEVWLWPGVAPGPDAYSVTASDGGTSLAAAFSSALATALARPEVALSADGSRLEWAPVAGAASYGCVATVAGAGRLDAVSRSPGCDVSGLPPGAYAASVRAFGADLVALSEDVSRAPALPARFDVSEASLAFVRPDPAAPQLSVAAAGGAFDSGMGPRTLAVWLSIRAPDGAATTSSWDVSVVGPGLPADAPLRFTYRANFPRLLVWSREVPATPGTYFVTAAAGASVFATFTLGDPPALPFVLDAAASPARSGSASVTWTPIAGARAYLVSAWEPASAAPAASFWVADPPARFPDGSFAPGVAYDVYVAATDADMSGATVPGSFSVSEYPYLPARFVAE